MKSPDQRSGNPITARTQSAFSLVEMLVVISIIAAVSAIAIPSIGKLHESSTEAKDRRNAQNIASVFASAQAAGVDFYLTGDKTATIQAVITGAKVTDDGPFYEAFFGVPGLSSDEANLAGSYLLLDTQSRMLVYDSE